MSELKPCPFCGCDLVTRHTGWLDHPKAKCILSGKVFHKGFIGQWNRRADLPPTLSAAMQLPEVKAMVVALEYGDRMCRLDFHREINPDDECFSQAVWDTWQRMVAALAAIKEPKP